MPKKKATGAVSKLTEVEQELLLQLEHGYRLETDSLGGNPLLRKAKDKELLRPADANARKKLLSHLRQHCSDFQIPGSES